MSLPSICTASLRWGRRTLHGCAVPPGERPCHSPESGQFGEGSHHWCDCLRPWWEMMDRGAYRMQRGRGGAAGGEQFCCDVSGKEWTGHADGRSEKTAGLKAHQRRPHLRRCLCPGGGAVFHQNLMHFLAVPHSCLCFLLERRLPRSSLPPPPSKKSNPLARGIVAPQNAGVCVPYNVMGNRRSWEVSFYRRHENCGGAGRSHHGGMEKPSWGYGEAIMGICRSHHGGMEMPSWGYGEAIMG
eukprot:gene11359-biopygen10901